MPPQPKRRRAEGTTTTFDQDVSIHVDEAIGCASISPSGRDVVLASRNGLFIIDLDAPYHPPRHIPHKSPWDVVDVQWSPFASRDSWIVSTSNQKALVWNLYLSGNDAIEHVLHGHDRAITDINFSAHHPDFLATCGVDSYILTWDLRMPYHSSGRFSKDLTTRDLVSRFADWDAGATQVKWNRQNPYIIASSHHKYLRIWDSRFGALPVKTINAHSTKIYGIDWNRTEESKILTCSLDKTIKLWDYNATNDAGEVEAERVIRTNYPVWRARHTPFGHGILAMPQNDNYDLHLYDSLLPEGVGKDDWPAPLHDFQGHEAKVKEFLWRFRGGVEDGQDLREFQLVSLAMDRNLHLHSLDPEILERVGYRKGQPADGNLIITRKGAEYRTFTIEDPDDQSRGREERSASADKGKVSEQPGRSELSALLKHSSSFHPAESSSQKSVTTRKKVGFQATTSAIRVFDPIQWMSGVKVGKREPRVFAHQPPSGDLISQRHKWTWNSAENLGDEIASVGDKYKKVSFEDVDVQGRTAVVFLSGPWGQEYKSVPMRINFEFPSSYPRSAPPHYILEKTTASIPDDTLKRIDFEIKAIAEMCRKRQKGSLEAIICYLLGERGLEESISWLSDDISDLIAGIELIEESDSDEEAIGEFLEGEEGMQMSGTDLGAKHGNANVPIPKECGAWWGQNGELAIFRPPKPETLPLFAGHLGSNYERFSKTARLTENFDRLHAASPEPEKGTSVSVLEEQDVSDSDWSSSSSSSSSEEEFGSYHNTFDRYGNLLGLNAGLKKSGKDRTKTSQESTTDRGTRITVAKSKSVIALHNLEDLLPAKRVLAEEYEIYGDGASVAQHNADAARRHGFSDLADIWILIKLIISNEVPLEVMSQSHRREPILILARRSIVRIKRKDSGLDLAFDDADSVTNPILRGRVKWGYHPLAASWLIPALFDYFEREADTQMLAMLSCMFSEPAGTEAVSTSMLRLHHKELPMSMQSPAFSLDYFPSQETAWSLLQPTLSIPSTPTVSVSRHPTPAQSINLEKWEKKLDVYGSAGSSNGPWGSDTIPSDPVTPYSTGHTPPALSRTNTYRSSASATASFSTSPEQSTRRSNSNLSTALASFSQKFMSSSPPVNSKSRTLEGDLSTSAPNSGITWGTNTFYSSSSANTNDLRRFRQGKRHGSMTPHASSFDEYAEYDDGAGSDTELSEDGDVLTAKPQEPVVAIKLKNQDKFDDEACLSAPLLAHVDAWKLSAYRQQYADQLLLWGLPVQCSEVLKFNGLTSYWDGPGQDEESRHALQLAIGKKQATPRSTTPQPLQTPQLIYAQQPIHFPKKLDASSILSVSPKKFRFNPDAPDFVPTSWQQTGSGFAQPGSQSPFPVEHLSIELRDGTSTPPPAVLTSSVEAITQIQLRNGGDTVTPEKAGSIMERTVPIVDSIPASTKVAMCNACWQKIMGLYTVCDFCAHVAHVDCVPPQADDDNDDDAGCEVGCGCNCKGLQASFT